MNPPTHTNQNTTRTSTSHPIDSPLVVIHCHHRVALVATLPSFSYMIRSYDQPGWKISQNTLFRQHWTHFHPGIMTYSRTESPSHQENRLKFTFERFALDQIEVVRLLEDSALEPTAEALQIATIDVEHESWHRSCGFFFLSTHKHLNFGFSVGRRRRRFSFGRKTFPPGEDVECELTAAAALLRDAIFFSEKCHMTDHGRRQKRLSGDCRWGQCCDVQSTMMTFWGVY